VLAVFGATLGLGVGAAILKAGPALIPAGLRRQRSRRRSTCGSCCSVWPCR
jgi:hypothetical protein